jgi:hypothetical protein
MVCDNLGQARVVMFGGTLEAGSLDEGTHIWDWLIWYIFMLCVCVYIIYIKYACIYIYIYIENTCEEICGCLWWFDIYYIYIPV